MHHNILRNNQQVQLYAVNFISLLSSLYMFRAAHTPIIRSTKFNCIDSHWYNHRLAYAVTATSSQWCQALSQCLASLGTSSSNNLRQPTCVVASMYHVISKPFVTRLAYVTFTHGLRQVSDDVIVLRNLIKPRLMRLWDSTYPSNMTLSQFNPAWTTIL